MMALPSSGTSTSCRRTPGTSTNALPVPWVEPVDISNALLFLASEEARYVTGTELRVDAGSAAK
jgi:NAD(P)-dependent dehydrogenase (short-subunit alcohol dehydrogenase family)